LPLVNPPNLHPGLQTPLGQIEIFFILLYDKKHENRFTINLILKNKLNKTLILNDEIERKKNQKIKKEGQKI